MVAAPAFTIPMPGAAQAISSEAPKLLQPVTIRAQEQSRQGEEYHLDGDVEILYESYTLRAEHAIYHDDTGDVQANGRVVLDGGPHDAHIVASRAEFNVKNDTGVFYDAVGTLGAVMRGNQIALTTSNPFLMRGRVVRKTGSNRFVVEHGSVTSCAEPRPTWDFHADKIDVVAGEDAKLYHSTFRLLNLPVFYFPYTKAPASADARTSGFLLPALGESNTKGYIIGESGYWAINRSNDLLAGAEFMSKRGWSETMHFRSRPSQNSSVELQFYGVQDRGINVQQTEGTSTGTVHQDQGGEEVRLLASDNRGQWRAAANIDYLSSFIFRQAFSPTYTQAVNSEVRSVGYLSRNSGGYSLNASAERYQNFYRDPTSSLYSDQIRILHLPMVEANALERRLADTPIFWGVDASIGGLQRSEPGFVTANLVGRFDLRPRVAIPLQFAGWSLRPEFAAHETLYSQQLGPSTGNPLGAAEGNQLNRRDAEVSVELRPPALEKTFGAMLFGRSLKHVIEPIFTYRYVTGVDNFQQVLRFDSVDIQSNTSQLQYDIIQRIYGHRKATRHEAGCEPTLDTPQALAAKETREKLPTFYIPGVSAVRPKCEDESQTSRELVSWEVKQVYYADHQFGGALVAGRRNVFADTIDLTGMAFLDGPRLWSPVVSKLRIQTTANTDVQWQFDYDSVKGRINSSAAFGEYRLGNYFFGASHVFFHVPANSVTEIYANEPLVFHQVRALIGYGHPNKRGFSGGASVGYDTNLNFLQYAAVQGSYNTDCCGFSFEYRHTNVSGVPVENQYRFAFTLANIGTFGNMKRQEKLY